MAGPLSGIDLDRWYLVWIAVSTVALVAAITSGDRVFIGFALGMCFFGIGEIANHPKQITLVSGGWITSRRRRWTVWGTFLNLAGVALMGWNGWRMGFA